MYNPVLRQGVPTPLAGQDKAEAISIRDVFRFVRESLSTILVAMLLCAVLGATFCLMVKPRYTANAQILIEPARTPALLQEPARAAATLETETGRIESQIQVIKSAQIAGDVIRQLALLDDPEFKLPARKPSLFALLLGLFRDEQGQELSDIEAARLTHAVDTFNNRLAVRRIGQSFVVEVQFSAEDAAKASTITNAVLDAYIKADVAAKADTARRGSTWLTERLNELRDQVAASRGALEQFKASSDVQSASERTVKLAQLESLTQTQSRLYDAFLQRSLETVQNITYPVPDARIIAAAVKPQSKSFPKTGLVIAFTGLVGAALGVGIAMARNGADRRIRSVKAAAAATNCSVLGAIATIPKDRIVIRGEAAHRVTAAKGLAALPALRTAWARGLGRRAESDFRALKVAFNTAQLAQPIKRLGITSPGRGEGKTTVATSLAAVLATAECRVLLVDLCSDDRTLSRSIAPDSAPGLTEYLADPQALPKVVVPHPKIKELYVLPLGSAPFPSSPAEMLAASRHLPNLEALSQVFDIVIFDMPDTENAPESFVLAPRLDAIVVVAEYRRTSIDVLSDTVASLRGSRAEVLGLVVNKVSSREINA
ncbi:GumC family protein [Methylobacterium oxalidis]|uniref:GumC family protein n=1 Tax=Methylobacterium oxalidis TaxID=944322 RepID=UPI0033157FA5